MLNRSASLAMSTSFLKALPGKLDIKRHSPSILYIPFCITAFLVHGGCMIAYLLWQPDPDMVYMFYIFAGLWGLGDAVIQTQINGMSSFIKQC